MNLINIIENSQKKSNITKLFSGDIVKINIWVLEGNKKRIQIFEGIIIAIKNKGISSSITVRKISNGEGVERMFPLHSPIIESIIVNRHSLVRKSKLYYLRNKKGRSSRIKQRLKK
ncbi:rplS [Wigglesworthia glossinidia endosymbiont of Glossina brevipalpis]|uniref:Large ribosomal subunit protein bL19 n=1 Tax=Wigglesworthia glossinidia brevipalpis TaxID=36870 RepID=RL19_WIGBR|nr:RecName: Full=Large ribosomal subunit protein bL19; AltName: Full=50S ribosomal protein L19 [Wigglesworthia glossinidia endosymbiont of Glossina brevipalpis]BAC24396.1 rplS [Wigglesworthia glossinidia endosymbiont of Glossina brevipalpis]